MYFPYLRSKQFELIALREFSEQVLNVKHIAPIIEPVKSELAGLTMAMKTMFGNGMKFALILNPNDGDFKRTQKNILAEVPELGRNTGKWIPAFLCQNNANEIRDIIQKNNLNDVMIVFKNGIEIGIGGIMDLLHIQEVQYIVNGDPGSRKVMRRLGELNKNIIRLDNCFIGRQKNADFIDIPEEKFTEEHRYYDSEQFYGVSDYTALPKDFKDGGMLPTVLAIHLTYEKTIADEPEIYVRHFVSDSNENQQNIQKKFFEAMVKVRTFYQNVERTGSVNELIQLLEEEKYPGLGVIKKLSIKNHIELMNRFFSE